VRPRKAISLGLIASMFAGLMGILAAKGNWDSMKVAVPFLIAIITVAAASAAKRSKEIKENDMSMYRANMGPGRGYQPGEASTTPPIHPIAVFWFFVLELASLGLFAGGFTFMSSAAPLAFGLALVLFILSFIVLFCLKVADQWDRVVVLRLGKYKMVQQPGIFWLAPFVDTIAKWIDTRVQTRDLSAEQTLTKDTVPVDVDAIMFWLVYDPKKASMEVVNYEAAVTWAAQTALRDLIGKTMLADLLVGRDILDTQLQEIIDAKTEPWGVSVQSVEIREIKIPGPLQDTMSRQAQA
jgi:hypothetical protein